MIYNDKTTKIKCAVPLVERRRSTPAPKEEEKVNEEQWPLREVVFVEDVKNVPVGKVSASEANIWIQRRSNFDYLFFFDSCFSLTASQFNNLLLLFMP